GRTRSSRCATRAARPRGRDPPSRTAARPRAGRTRAGRLARRVSGCGGCWAWCARWMRAEGSVDFRLYRRRAKNARTDSRLAGADPGVLFRMRIPPRARTVRPPPAGRIQSYHDRRFRFVLPPETFMPTYTQDGRPLGITTPLGKDVL